MLIIFQITSSLIISNKLGLIPLIVITILAKNNLLKGKASIRLNARDPFGWMRFKATTQYGNVDISVLNRFDSRQYGVNFTYRFGKQQGQSRRKSSATEEEQQRVGAGN